MTDDVRVFRQSRAILAESLVWWDDALHWCDIDTGALVRSELAGDPGGADDATLMLPAPLAAFHPAHTPMGHRWIVSLESDIALVTADGTVQVLAHVRHPRPGMRLNEGKVAPDGRWIAGSMGIVEQEADGAFCAVGGDGSVTELIPGIGVANGLEWSLDGTEIYFTDTAAETIYRAPYDEQVGEAVVFHRGEQHDGLVMDTEGFLWGALYGSGAIARYSPDGEEVRRIELPAPNPTSLAFGGHGLRTLYIATAREKLTEQQLERHPLSGSILSIDLPTGGRPPHVFAG
jgi:sugar lactone lactonase YvrE